MTPGLKYFVELGIIPNYEQSQLDSVYVIAQLIDMFEYS